MKQNDRRWVLKAGGAAAAGAFLNLNPRAHGANERVTLGLIGGRNQGRLVAGRAIEAGGQFKTFCDLDPAIREKVGGEIAKQQGSKPALETDYRRLLDDKSIDAVVIATPDHWHTRIAIQACQAGKDVYCEKPLSQTIREGQHFRSAIEAVAGGQLGKVCEIKAWIYQTRGSIGRPADGEPPAGVDYDVWLGPAPKRPFNKNRFHYNGSTMPRKFPIPRS
jgi:predicted dehydrogenase